MLLITMAMASLSASFALVRAGSMLLVLLMTMATASLSASFAVFLVRERANKSKHVQVRRHPLASLSYCFPPHLNVLALPAQGEWH